MTTTAVLAVINAPDSNTSDLSGLNDSFTKLLEASINQAEALAKASNIANKLVDRSVPLPELMKKYEGLQKETERFNAGRKTPEEIADDILKEQTESINKLDTFFKEAERVLGVDNGDVSDFRIQLESLQGVYMATQEARGGQRTDFAAGEDGITRKNSIDTLNNVFKAQLEDLSKGLEGLKETIKNKPEMQKEGRKRAGSNDSGFDSRPSSPGMGGPK